MEIITEDVQLCAKCGNYKGTVEEKYNGKIPVYCICAAEEAKIKYGYFKHPSMTCPNGDKFFWIPGSSFNTSDGKGDHCCIVFAPRINWINEEMKKHFLGLYNGYGKNSWESKEYEKIKFFIDDLEKVIKDDRLKDKIIIADCGTVDYFLQIHDFREFNHLNVLKWDDLEKLVDVLGKKICWLSLETSLIDIPLLSEQYKEIRKKMEYVLIASDFSEYRTYSCLNLYKIYGDGSYEIVKNDKIC